MDDERRQARAYIEALARREYGDYVLIEDMAMEPIELVAPGTDEITLAWEARVRTPTRTIRAQVLHTPQGWYGA